MRFFLIVTILYEAILFIFSTYDICCTTQDDAYHIVMFHGHYPFLQHLIHYLTHTATRPLFTFFIRVPYLIDELWFYKCISYAAFFAEITAFYWLLKRVFDKNIATLFVIVHLAFLQYTFQHNILFAYPFYFHFALLLLFLSLLFFVHYLQNGKGLFYLFSILFYTLTLMMYEVFVVYGVLFAALLYTYRRSWKLLLGFTVPIFLLIALHFYLQHFFHRNYSGTTLYFGSFKDFLITLILHTSSAFPLFNALFIQKLHQLYFLDKSFYQGVAFSFNPLILLDWKSYLKAFLVFVSSYYLLQKISFIQKISIKALLFFLFILIFLPNLLLALTKKYQIWAVQYHNFHYVTTYFSIIAFNLFVVVLAFYWVKAKKRRALFVALLFGIISLLVDYGNYYPLRALKLSSQKWHLVRALAKSNLVPKDVACIEAPSLWSHTYSDIKMGSGYWDRYFKTQGGKITITKTKHCPAKLTILQNPFKAVTIARIDYIDSSLLIALQKIDLPGIIWKYEEGVYVAKVKRGLKPAGFY